MVHLTVAASYGSGLPGVMGIARSTVSRLLGSLGHMTVQFRPMLRTAVPAPPATDGWVHECRLGALHRSEVLLALEPYCVPVGAGSLLEVREPPAAVPQAGAGVHCDPPPPGERPPGGRLKLPAELGKRA